MTFNKELHLAKTATEDVTLPANETRMWVDLGGTLNFREFQDNGYARFFMKNESETAKGASIHAISDGEGPPGAIGIRSTQRTQNYSGGLPTVNIEKIGDNYRCGGSVMQYQNVAHRATWTCHYTVENKYKSYTNDNVARFADPNGTVPADSGHLCGVYLQAYYDGMATARSFHPATGGTTWSLNLGNPNDKWETVYANSPAISTSDRNQKQDIEELSDAEKKVAVKLKGLIRKYRMKDAVGEKGEDARIHVGVIAQDVEDAFSSEELDASRYGVFCKDTVYDVHIDGNPTGISQCRGDMVLPFDGDDEAPENATLHPRDVYSVRYGELLAFIISAM